MRASGPASESLYLASRPTAALGWACATGLADSDSGPRQVQFVKCVVSCMAHGWARGRIASSKPSLLAQQLRPPAMYFHCIENALYWVDVCRHRHNVRQVRASPCRDGRMYVCRRGWVESGTRLALSALPCRAFCGVRKRAPKPGSVPAQRNFTMCLLSGAGCAPLAAPSAPSP